MVDVHWSTGEIKPTGTPQGLCGPMTVGQGLCLAGASRQLILPPLDQKAKLK